MQLGRELQWVTELQSGLKGCQLIYTGRLTGLWMQFNLLTRIRLPFESKTLETESLTFNE